MCRQCEEDYPWNPSTYACECDKDCKICEYLEECECIKSFIDDATVTCDEIVDTAESVVINPGDGINYWLIDVIPLTIACLLLLMTIIVKYCMKRELTIQFLPYFL